MSACGLVAAEEGCRVDSRRPNFKNNAERGGAVTQVHINVDTSLELEVVQNKQDAVGGAPRRN